MGWRDNSTRILVWFGDNPGHDPAPPDAWPGPETQVFLGDAIDALQDQSIVVLGANLKGPGDGIDQTGQATAITAATGGALYNNFTAADIVAKINELLTIVLANYTEVALDISEVPGEVTVNLLTQAHVGVWDRSMTRFFDFSVSFTLDGPGIGPHEFPVHALVDGLRVATERDTINGDGEEVIPEPSTLALLGLGFAGLGLAVRRRRRKS